MVNRSSGKARHQFGERTVTYSFENPHLRGPVTTDGKKVLIVGDSYTFGWLLRDEDTYVTKIQRSLDASFGHGYATILNAAAGGWGTADYVAYVEEFGEDLAPDMILVFFNGDDLGRAYRSGLWQYNSASRNLKPSNAGYSRIKRVANSIPAYQFFLQNSHLLQLARSAAISRGDKVQSNSAGNANNEQGDKGLMRGSRLGVLHTKEAVALGKALFVRLATWCNERDIALAVTTTGCQSTLADEENDPELAFLAEATTFFKELEVPFFDPTKSVQKDFQESPSKFYIEGDGHPSEAGATVIATHVTPFILKQVEEMNQSN